MTKPTIILLALLVLLGVAIGSVVAAEQVSEKLSIPSEAARQEALKLVKDVYREDFDGAKTAPKKADLAKKLLQEGIATKDSPAGKYVLLQEARSLALQVNSASTALAATDELAHGFSVDELKMQAEVLATLAKPEPNAKETPLLIESARRFVLIAIADDRVDIAESLLSSGMAAAKRSKNLTAPREFTVQLNYVKELKKELEQVLLALKSLDANPTDAEANRVVGRYRCLQKGEWDLGLPMLALANDKAIKSIAEEELVVPSTAAEQIELGDHWWALAEKETEPYRSRMQQRSGFWYEQGLPSLAGLAKARVEKQLRTVKAIRSASFIPDQQSRPPAAVEPNVGKDIRSRWIITTYGRSIEDEGGGQWVERDLKTRKLVVRYRQSSRTNQFVELFCPDHGTTTRLFTNTAQQPNKTGGGWGWVSFGYWSTPEGDAEFNRIIAQPAPDVPPGDHRRSWVNESYKNTVSRAADGFWDCKGDNSPTIDHRYAKEIARTADYVECMDLKGRYRFRISDKKTELFTDGEWKWSANGHW